MTPKLPSVRELARALRARHKAPGEVIYAVLAEVGDSIELRYRFPYSEVLLTHWGFEAVPPADVAFDAHAAARRLISDARSSMKGMK